MAIDGPYRSGMLLRRVTRSRALLLDVAAGTALTAFTQYEIWSSTEVAAPRAAQAACFAVITLSVVLWRRLHPLGLALAAAGLTVQTVLLGDAPVVGGLVAVLVLTYGAAAHAALRPALLGLGILLVAIAVEPVADARTRGVTDALGNAAIFGVLWATGRVVRQLRQRGASWERRAQDLESQREEQVRLALADERQRIARELHDVVAHSVGVMVLQAGAARQHLGLDPVRARQPLLVVEDVGRQALDELHRLLQVLRRPDDLTTPPAGLAQLDQLVEHVRRSGLDVQVQITGEHRDLAPGLDLTAYRVLQEALTNVLKHAPGARTEIGLGYFERELVLCVTDTGSTHASPSGAAGGHGLLGMRERVLLYGGVLDAGPEDGGFAVRVRLPMLTAVGSA